MRWILLTVALCFATLTAHAQVGQLPGGNAGSKFKIVSGGSFSIAFDNAANAGSNGGSGNFSTSYTGSSLTHGLLVVCIVGDTTTDSVTGVTYNSVSATF